MSSKHDEYDDAMSVNAVGKLLESINQEKKPNEAELIKQRAEQKEEVTYPEGYVPPSFTKEPVERRQYERRETDRKRASHDEDGLPFEDRLKRTNRHEADESETEEKQSMTADFSRRKISLDAAEREKRRRVLLGIDLDPPKNNAADMLPRHDVSEPAYQEQPIKRPQMNTKKVAADPFTRKKQNAAPPVMRLAVLGVFFVTLSLLAFFIWRNNALNAQLAEQEEAREVSAMAEDQAQMDTLEAEIEELNNYIAQLQQQLRLLAPTEEEQGLLAELLNLGEEETGAEETSVSVPLQPAGPIGPAGSTIHVVQEGELLGSIASYHFGSWLHYTHIMQTNGLTSVNIRPGDELIIVPLPS